MEECARQGRAAMGLPICWMGNKEQSLGAHTQSSRSSKPNTFQGVIVFRGVVFVECYVCALDSLGEKLSDVREQGELLTMRTNNKSSRMSASCTSRGISSMRSSLSFPLGLGATRPDTTREFRGARTNDSSAMNEGSKSTHCETLLKIVQ